MSSRSVVTACLLGLFCVAVIDAETLSWISTLKEWTPATVIGGIVVILGVGFINVMVIGISAFFLLVERG